MTAEASVRGILASVEVGVRKPADSYPGVPG
jgi:hypothetical protein